MIYGLQLAHRLSDHRSDFGRGQPDWQHAASAKEYYARTEAQVPEIWPLNPSQRVNQSHIWGIPPRRPHLETGNGAGCRALGCLKRRKLSIRKSCRKRSELDEQLYELVIPSGMRRSRMKSRDLAVRGRNPKPRVPHPSALSALGWDSTNASIKGS